MRRGVCVCVCSSLVIFFIIRVPYEKLKSDDIQTWVTSAIGVTLYDNNEVKGHVELSYAHYHDFGIQVSFYVIRSHLKS